MVSLYFFVFSIRETENDSQVDEAIGSPGRLDYMFNENGDPCVEHNGQGTCIVGLNIDDGTLDMGACDLGADRCGGNGERCL